MLSTSRLKFLNLKMEKNAGEHMQFPELEIADVHRRFFCIFSAVLCELFVNCP